VLIEEWTEARHARAFDVVPAVPRRLCGQQTETRFSLCRRLSRAGRGWVGAWNTRRWRIKFPLTQITMTEEES
jgi:hypothetical protein